MYLLAADTIVLGGTFLATISEEGDHMAINMYESMEQIHYKNGTRVQPLLETSLTSSYYNDISTNYEVPVCSIKG